MAIATVQHIYTATQADGTHAGMLQPSNWNSNHAITIDGVVGTNFAGTNILGTIDSSGMSLSVAPGGGGGGATVNGSTGNVTIVAGGAIGLTNNASTISISSPIQSVQTDNMVSINGSTGNITGVQFSSNAMQTGERANYVVVGDTTKWSNASILQTNGNAASFLAADGAYHAGGGGGNTLTVSGSNGTIQSNGLSFLGSNGINVYTTTGNQIVVSMPSAGGAQTGISSMGNSQATYTSGAVQFIGSNQVTVRSTTGQGFVFDVTTAAQTVQPAVGQLNGSSGTMSIAFGSNLTGASNASTITLGIDPNYSTHPHTQYSPLAHLHNLTFVGANTVGGAGSTTAGASAYNMSAAGIVSLAGSGSSLIISAPAQTDLTNHAHTGYILIANSTLLAGSSVVSRVLGIAGSNASTASGNVQFANGNNVTFGLNGNIITATATFAQSVQPSASVVMSAGTDGSISNTIFSLGNANGFSFKTAGGSIVGSYTVPSVPAQTAQTGNLYVTAGATQLSSTAGIDYRSLSFAGAGIASVGVSNGVVLVSVPSGGGGGDGYNIVSAGSIGTTGTAWSSLSASIGINGSGAITVSQNNSNQLVINAPAMSVLSAVTNCTLGTTGSTIGISVGAGGGGGTNTWFINGNTAGANNTYSYTDNKLYLSGGNNITLSQNGSTIGISGLDAVWNLVGTGGDTQGTTQSNLSANSFYFKAGPNITLSGSSNSIVISAPSPSGGPMLSYYENMPWFEHATMSMTTSGTQNIIAPFVVPYSVSGSYIRIPVQVVWNSTSFATTANTQFSFGHSMTNYYVLYTQGVGANSRSLQSVYSTSHGVSAQVSVSFGTATNGNNTVYHNVTLPSAGGTATTGTAASYGFSNGSIQISTTHLTAWTGTKWLDIPFALSLPADQYWIATAQNRVTATQGTNMSGVSLGLNTLGISQWAVGIAPWGQTKNAASMGGLQPAQGTFTINAATTTASIVMDNVFAVTASNGRPYFQIIREA